MTQEAVSTRILGHLKLAAVPPPLAPARSRQATCAWVASAHAIAGGLRGDVCATEVGLVSGRHLGAFEIPYSPSCSTPGGLLPYPIPRSASSPRGPCCAALRLTLGHTGRAAALRWVYGKRRGRGVAAGGWRWGACSRAGGAQGLLNFLSAPRRRGRNTISVRATCARCACDTDDT